MKTKLIYTDNGKDIALTGDIVAEDDFFVTLVSNEREYRLGKKSIVCIKPSTGEPDGKRD